jgi:hypothetical protein
MAANAQGFAPGQSEITNYKTVGSVAANNFQKAHRRRLPNRCWAKFLFRV